MPRFLKSLDPVASLALVAGLYLVIHYAWVMDDGFIYFRYVDNLVFLGHGLVYNAGEYVEGYSSPLWTLLLIPFRAAHLNWWTTLRLVGLLSFAATWFILRIVQHDLVPRGRTVGLPFLYFGLTYAPLTNFTSGLETPLVQLMAATYAWWILRPGSRTAQVLVGLSPLVRHEFLLPLLVASALLAWRRGARPWIACGTFVGSMTAWLLFRVVYYASLVPNTFPLKDGTWWAQGARYLVDAALPYHLPWLLLAGIGVVVWRRRTAPVATEARVIMVLVGLPVAVYVVRVGGDFLHYRTLAFPLGLLVCALSGLPEHALQRGPERLRAWSTALVAAGLAALFFTARPAQLKALPYYLADFPYNRDQKLENNLELSHEIEDAMVHRAQRELKFNPWGDGNALELRHEMSAARGMPPTQLLSDYWCTRIYRKWDTHVEHSLGLTSALLAHMDVESSRPGHKWLLAPFSRQIVAIYQRHGLGPEAFERVYADGVAPGWVRDNVASIRHLLARTHNRHSLAENLRLALSTPTPIRIPEDELAQSRALMKNTIERAWEKQ